MKDSNRATIAYIAGRLISESNLLQYMIMVEENMLTYQEKLKIVK